MRNAIIEEDLEYIVTQPLPWAELDKKTFLVTGANGFIPAYIVETLLYLKERKVIDEIEIIGLVRNQERAKRRFVHSLNRRELKFVVQDVCDPIRLDGRIDYILHSASQASPKYFKKDPVGTLAPNIIGTYNLLELARKRGLECFLYVSSGEVYGKVNEEGLPIREDFGGWVNPLDVRSCYAESKRMAETMCISWHSQYGVPIKVLRPFHVYGPGMALDDGRVFADFVADVVGGRDIVMKSDGKAIRAFCYLADAILAFFFVLLIGEAGQAYNVGNDKALTTVFDLAKKLVTLFPEKKLRVIRKEEAQSDGYLKSTVAVTYPDIAKIKNLGWHPTFSLEEGFRRTIASFQNEP